jgi:tRNA pseudouridine38-40 synthase
MPRYKLTVEYDGTDFVGWQRQANGLSVQQAIEDAIREFSGETVGVFGAGRTDAGVHALGQCCHLDLTREHPPGTVQDALNAHLRPRPISVLAAELVPAEFDARRSARQRSYRYRIVNRRSPLAIERDRAWQIAKPLDAAAMHRAAQALVGEHDFTSFRAANCQARSPIKTLEQLDIIREGEEIRITARAGSFLYHQVRAMVGTLAWVGEGRWREDDVRQALAARDRRRAGPTAPPCGLYLVAVTY